ncbi:hypothetical protein J4526_04790 [Desulfurococcaceae archaeon MEX13E-LK6-19]|nr:hypothetical protein J4526_04790 [Desulfurococcaceae archaeon MEX13E-LK6-19]
MVCSSSDIKRALFELVALRDALNNLHNWCSTRSRGLSEIYPLIEEAQKRFAELKKSSEPEHFTKFLEVLDKIYRSRAFEDLVGLDIKEVEGRLNELEKYMKAIKFLNECYEWKQGHRDKIVIEPLVVSFGVFRKIRIPYTEFYKVYMLFNQLEIRLNELARILKLKDSVLKTFEHLYDLARITHSIRTEKLGLPKEHYSTITLITTKLSPSSMPFDISLKSVKNLFIEVNDALNNIDDMVKKLSEEKLVKELVKMLSK